MITSGSIETFFKGSSEPASGAGDFLLYHLRTDLEELYGKEGDDVMVAPSHAFLATMGIMAGLDYLSQVYDDGGRSGFVKTLEDLLSTSHDNAEALYQLRCALMHKIGLSIKSQTHLKGVVFNFELTDQYPDLITKLKDSGAEVYYRVSLKGLKRDFRSVIDKLQAIVQSQNHSKLSHIINEIGQRHSQKMVRR